MIHGSISLAPSVTPLGGCGYRAATRPLLSWIRYNPLARSRATLASVVPPSDILLSLIAFLFGWEKVERTLIPNRTKLIVWQAYGDLADCGIHGQALIQMLKQRREKGSTQLDEVGTRGIHEPLIPSAPRLPPGLAELRARDLLSPHFVNLIS